LEFVVWGSLGRIRLLSDVPYVRTKMEKSLDLLSFGVMARANKVFIKNMVCNRCIMTVEQILNELHIPFNSVCLGEVELPQHLTSEERSKFETSLNKVGFELIETRVNKIIEDIKKATIEYINLGMDSQDINLSKFITKKIPYDYSYLSDLFSSVEGKTIEQYFMLQRIEKVKEMLVYDQLSLTEISYQTGFSSVHHLSSQFKKLTGLTPSHFKKIGQDKRRSLDQV
jgi:AraC family transcriptional regulator